MEIYVYVCVYINNRVRVLLLSGNDDVCLEKSTVCKTTANTWYKLVRGKIYSFLLKGLTKYAHFKGILIYRNLIEVYYIVSHAIYF